MARQPVSGRRASTRINNLVFNGGFETAPTVLTAATNTAGVWINGLAAGSSASRAQGWGTVALTASSAASFDTSSPRTGTYALKLSTLNSLGTVTVGTYKSSPLGIYLIPLAANTTYVLSGYIKTNNVATNGAFLDLKEYNVAIGTITTTSTNKVSGTANYTNVSVSITTSGTTAWGTILLRNNVAGNISDAYFDDITLIPASIGRIAASGRCSP